MRRVMFIWPLRRLSIVLSIVLSSALVVATLIYAFCPRPELKTFTSYSNAFFDKEGALLKLTLADDDRYRLYQDLAQVSPEFLSATLLYEDKHFYRHSGVDFLALVRAFWTTYVLQQRRIGASTITMQVARLRWQISSNTLAGKIEQIIRAMQLNRHYNKQQILQAYINMAPYGGNIEGIGAASLIYFNKLPGQLSLPQALTLAVIPQNPTARNPSRPSGYQQLLAARQNLFQRWLKQYPADRAKQKYLAMPLQVSSTTELPDLAPHFTQYLSKNRAAQQAGMVNSSLDLKQQKLLEQGIKAYVASTSVAGIDNAAALLLNYQTMEIEAMVGSADFYQHKIQGQVNGTTAKRSPGSTLKPFVYALAIDEGLIHPMSLLKDAPRRYGGFTPENYDKKFLGPVLAKDALIQSRNVPAVTLQAQLKQTSLFDFLQAGGVKGLKNAAHYGLALALGGAELTMFELVSLYSVLANNGLQFAIKIQQTDQDASGLGIKDGSQGKRLLSPEASFLILDMLKDNPAPNALGIDLDYLQNNQVAWKTGTSWAFRDAWAIGISGPYVLAVWLGNFNGRGNNALIGRSAAGPLLFSLFDAVLGKSTINDNPWRIEDALPPLNLKKVQVCANTGDLYQKYCPWSESTWFIPGVSPIKVSNIYRPVAVDQTTGLRRCDARAAASEMQVYEFWPSDFLQLFDQAGISLKTPPPYAANCSLTQKSSTGLQPIITSPQSHIDYVIQSHDQEQRVLVFSAIVDPDVEKVFWFVNGKYEGSAARGMPFMWTASSGQFRVSGVDDSGRSASQDIKVVLIR